MMRVRQIGRLAFQCNINPVLTGSGIRGSYAFFMHDMANLHSRFNSSSQRHPSEVASEVQNASLRNRNVLIQQMLQNMSSSHTPPTDRNIATELQSLYQETNPNTVNEMCVLLQTIHQHHPSSIFAADWLAITQFLHDDKLLAFYLNKLEQQLQQHARKIGSDRNFILRDDGLLAFNKHDDKKYKILSSYLYQWAAANGFENIVKVANVLGNKKFFNLMRTRTFFKEIVPGFIDDHGVWTHSLQWYLIIMHYNNTHFLSNGPLDLYSELGNPEQYANKKSPMWNVLFDNRKGTGFDNPVLLTKQLSSDRFLSNSEKRPLLTGSLQRAQIKRDKTKSDLQKKYGDDIVNGVVNVDGAEKKVRFKS